MKVHGRNCKFVYLVWHRRWSERKKQLNWEFWRSILMDGLILFVFDVE
jgi:hypothetical protein